MCVESVDFVFRDFSDISLSLLSSFDWTVGISDSAFGPAIICPLALETSSISSSEAVLPPFPLSHVSAPFSRHLIADVQRRSA